MGVVYEAVEEALGRTVALKLVAPERAASRGSASGSSPSRGWRPRSITRTCCRCSAPASRGRAAVARRCGSSTAPTCARWRRCPPTRAARDRGPGRRGAGRRARAAARAPRRQARQRARHRRRPRLPDRLRPREGARPRQRPHPHRRGRRHARLHRARTHPRRGRRPGRRPLLARLPALRRVHRRGAVSDARGHRARSCGRTCPSRRRPSVRASRPCSPARWRRTRGAVRERRRAGRGGDRRGGCGRGRRRSCSTPPRRSERGIRVAAPELGGQAADLVAAFEHAAVRAALLREALADTPPERIERRLAEVRAGQDPARRSSSPRSRSTSRCSAGCRRRSRPSTPRPSASCSSSRPCAAGCSPTTPRRGERLAALQDELETLAERLDAQVGNPPPRVAYPGRGAARPCAP